MTLPTVIGVHHKAGTLLASAIADLLAEARPVGLAHVPSQLRKLPLSQVLRALSRSGLYLSCWCEHQIDADAVKFLHFVREPSARIASAYLYHRRRAPNDLLRWVDWPIFEFRGRKSYAEVVNALELGDGLVVEAIRSFPEMFGSARAFASARALPAGLNLPVWLHRFEQDGTAGLSEIFRFVHGDDDGLDAFMAGAEKSAILIDEARGGDRRGHVTRDDPLRDEVDAAIAGSADIARLYDEVARSMGLAPASAGEARIADIVDAIKGNAGLLATCTHVLESSPRFWSDRNSAAIWQAIALANLGNGHLMMQPFIQAFLARIA